MPQNTFFSFGSAAGTQLDTVRPIAGKIRDRKSGVKSGEGRSPNAQCPMPNAQYLKIDWRLWGFGSHGLVVRFGSHSELSIITYIERVTTVSKLDTK